MKKKYVLIVALLLLFNTFGSFFVFADKSQPAVCSGPSKEMSQYFDFQMEMRDKLFNSDASGRLLTVGNSKGWLFSNGTLGLSSTATDLVVGSVLGRASSILSSSITSLVLLLMAGGSTFGSAINSFGILFKDRPIVRDYKEMLDIETKLFDAAFFRSKQLNLTRPIDGDIVDDLDEIIKKYRNLGLLGSGEPIIGKSVNISDILVDLVRMNSAMMHFISYGDGGVWALEDYNGCFGTLDDEECVSSTAILRFDEDAIEKLREDYHGIGAFGSCNQYKLNFTSKISKGGDNANNLVESAMQDIEAAHERLKGALLGEGTRSKVVTDPCVMSEYEMAQLRAYWGSDWECGDGVSIASTVNNFSKNKEAIGKYLEKVEEQIKESVEQVSETIDRVFDDIFNSDTTAVKSKKWKEVFGTGTIYNPEFSLEMYGDYKDVYDSVMDEFFVSQFNASASDLSVDLLKIQGLVNQVDSASDAIGEDNGKGLKKVLLDIVNYQCSE